MMAATGWPDNAATHLATALVTGVVSTTVTNPVDVVKTFMFVGKDGYRVFWVQGIVTWSASLHSLSVTFVARVQGKCFYGPCHWGGQHHRHKPCGCG